MIVRRRSYKDLIPVLLCVLILGVGGFFVAYNIVPPPPPAPAPVPVPAPALTPTLPPTITPVPPDSVPPYPQPTFVTASMPAGPSTGKTNQVLTFSTSADTNLAGSLEYRLDWGDGSYSSWSSLPSTSHSWSSPGTYTIRAQARLVTGALTFEWSPSKTVNIAVETFRLSISVSPSGSGSISPSSGTYDSGTQVTLSATPSLGYEFEYWSGDASDTSPITTINMDSEKNVIAHFVLDNNPPFTPSNPAPANGARDISDFILSWSSGDPDLGDTVTYDIYFGSSSPPPLLFSHQSGAIVTQPFPMPLPDTRCYWKIIVTDSHGASTEGPIWDFTTESALPDVRIQSVILPSDAKKRGEYEIWVIKTYYTTLRIVNNESVDITVDWQAHSSVTGDFDSGIVVVPRGSYKEIKRDYSYDTTGQVQITYKIFYEGTELDSWSGSMYVAP